MQIIEVKPIEKMVLLKKLKRKKRRLRKKFLKRYGFRIEYEYHFPADRILQMGNIFYAHEPIFSLLRHFQRQRQREVLGTTAKIFGS